MQGELFGRAMPAERVEAMLSESIDRAAALQPPSGATVRGSMMWDRLDSGREMRQS